MPASMSHSTLRRGEAQSSPLCFSKLVCKEKDRRTLSTRQKDFAHPRKARHNYKLTYTTQHNANVEIEPCSSGNIYHVKAVDRRHEENEYLRACFVLSQLEDLLEAKENTIVSSSVFIQALAYVPGWGEKNLQVCSLFFVQR